MLDTSQAKAKWQGGAPPDSDLTSRQQKLTSTNLNLPKITSRTITIQEDCGKTTEQHRKTTGRLQENLRHHTSSCACTSSIITVLVKTKGCPLSKSRSTPPASPPMAKLRGDCCPILEDCTGGDEKTGQLHEYGKTAGRMREADKTSGPERASRKLYDIAARLRESCKNVRPARCQHRRSPRKAEPPSCHDESTVLGGRRQPQKYADLRKDLAQTS